MMLSRRILFLCAILTLFITGNTVAQSGVVSIQQVGGLISGTTVQAGANLRFLIKFENTTGQKCNVSNGFKITSPDDITWDSTTIDSIGPINDGGTPGDPSDDFASYFLAFFDITHAFNEFSCDGILEDTLGFIAAGNPTKSNRQMPETWNDSVFAITVWFGGDQSAAGKSICIDSARWFDGGTWVWVGRNLADYFPAYQGLPGQPYSSGVGAERLGSGYCFDIYAPGLGLSVDSLGFSAIAGGATPPAQNFTVNSTGDDLGDHLAFTLVEASPWLLKTPASGTTPRSISVSVNITGLAPGVYIDSIEVQSAGAYNSPLYEKVTLTVAAPAPTISVNKSSLNFVALTGGANPASQSMIIKNVGGATLNWTATNSSLWLDVTPSSGIDSELVSVSADITGLGVGDHFDTIVVIDLAATNDSVRVPVKLTLGSSLPMIAVDSAVNHIIVDAPDNAPPRSIYIRNAGVGALTYTLSETSTHLFTVTPMSGSAPDSVHLTFKVLGGVVGQQYFDTLWVTSPEAVNSPYPVVFHFVIVEEAAFLNTSTDTVKITSYGCPIAGSPPVSATFIGDNSGGDSPKIGTIMYESDLVSVTPLQGTLPQLFTVQDLQPGLPSGVYYDSIFLTAEFAYNSPRMVIVQYTSIVENPPASMALSRILVDVPRQEQTGPVAATIFITNGFPGCMPWTVDEEIPWMVPSATSGNVPSALSAILQIDDLTLGTYTDSFYVNAPLDPNGPQKVNLRVRMWRYHGDWNWDGRLDLSDLSMMISYLLTGSPQPQPTYIVGDTDCSGLVDLSDLSRMVAFILPTKAPICGNP